jgi:phage tail tape-measure protein
VAGAVVGGLFGSQFGTIGTVVGGAVGFFLTNWLVEKFTSHYDEGYRPPEYRRGWFGSGSYSGNLQELRDAFFKAHDNYRAALSSGTDAEKQAAKDEYDKAREAYFKAKQGSNQ